jgi:hypothetical protein
MALFLGNNNTILNLIGSGASGTTAIAHSYGPVDNTMLQYPPLSMTSDSSGGYTSSASGSFATNLPWNAFDSNTSTSWVSVDPPVYDATTGSYTGTTTTTTNLGTLSGEWLQLDMPQQIFLRVIGLTPTSTFAQSRGPNNWSICARNSVSDTWQVIFSSTFTAFYGGTNELKLMALTNPTVTTVYNSFRLVFLNAGWTGTTNRNYINLMELRFYGFPVGRGISGTWNYPIQVYFAYNFHQNVVSQQPTVNTTLTVPDRVEFSRTSQQHLLNQNSLFFQIDTRGGCTVVAYVNMNSGDANGNNERIIDLSTTSNTSNIILRRNGTLNSFTFEIWDNTVVTATVSGGTIVPGQWTSIVGRYVKASNIIQLYQDNVLVATSVPSQPPNNRFTTSNYIGRSNDPLNPCLFNGSIGGILAYDLALTDAEVSNALLLMYTQNQITTLDLNSITPQRTIIKVFFLAARVNSLFDTNTYSVQFYRNRWFATGTADFAFNTGTTCVFGYSDNGIQWSGIPNGTLTVTPTNNSFDLVYGTVPDPPFPQSVSAIVPNGTYNPNELALVITSNLATLPSPTITVTWNSTSARFVVNISSGYYVGTVGGSGLTGSMGFNDMFVNPPYAFVNPSLTAPNPIQGFIFRGGYTITRGGSLWVAGGEGGGNTLAYSLDGLNWTGLGTSVFSTRCLQIAYNPKNGRWVGAGDFSTNTIGYSSDGINWTAVNVPGLVAKCVAVANYPSYTIWVVGDSGNIRYSLDDGLTWTIANTTGIFGSNFVRAVAWNGKIWVAGSTGSTSGTNTFATSTDGINWTGRGNPESPTSITIYNVNWNGSYWIATGTGNTGTNRIWTSTDGITWTGRTGQSLSNRFIFANGSRFSVPI